MKWIRHVTHIVDIRMRTQFCWKDSSDENVARFYNNGVWECRVLLAVQTWTQWLVVINTAMNHVVLKERVCFRPFEHL